MNSDELLVTPTAALALNILPSAYLLEQSYEKYMKPPVAGVYLKGHMYAVMREGEQYYTSKACKGALVVKDKLSGQVLNKLRLKSMTEIKPGQDMSDLFCDVVDSNGTVVIPAYAMADKPRYLSTYPMLPYRGLQVARLVIEDYIARLTCHGYKPDSSLGLENYLTPEGIDLWKRFYFDRSLETVLNQVTEFIGKDTFHYYFLKSIGNDIIVEKTVDYRAYLWVKSQEESCEEG